MPLVSCPDCMTEVSDKAASCPKCGYPVSRMRMQAKVGEAGSSLLRYIFVGGGRGARYPTKTYLYILWAIVLMPVLVFGFQRMAINVADDFPSKHDYPALSGQSSPTAKDMAVIFTMAKTVSREDVRELSQKAVNISFLLFVPALLLAFRVKYSRGLNIAFVPFMTFGLLVFVVNFNGMIGAKEGASGIVAASWILFSAIGILNIFWTFHLAKSPELKAVFSRKDFSFE